MWLIKYLSVIQYPACVGSFGTNVSWKRLSMGLYFSYELGVTNV